MSADKRGKIVDLTENAQENVCGESISLAELIKDIANGLKFFNSQHVSESSGDEYINNTKIEALINDINNELDVKAEKHATQSEYERLMIKKATMTMELSKLKGEYEIARQKTFSNCSQIILPSTRNSKIATFEGMIDILANKLDVMESKLSKIAEHEKMYSDGGRWNQIHSLSEAKSMLNYLFDLTSSSRCQLWDKEVILKEKDLLISEYREKIFKLNNQNK